MNCKSSRCAAVSILGVVLLCSAACSDREGGPAAKGAPAAGDASGPQRQWFTEITEEVGLDFVHETGARGELGIMEIVCSGAALFDYDNDGDLDIYLTTGNSLLPEEAVAESPVNRMYRQESDGRFTDVTQESGLGDGSYGMGVAIGDVDNDGLLDVYVTNYGPNRLYRNLGDGVFADITDSAGVGVASLSSSAAFVDYDRDGFLDLYVCQYLVYVPSLDCTDYAGRPVYCGPTEYPPQHDVLLHNNGDGSFTDVSEAAGITSVSACAGLGVTIDYLTDDDLIDIYVANDGYENQLWMNQGDGTFRDIAMISGTAYSAFGYAEAGMGIVAADFDNDGLPDLFMTHLRQESNRLYRNLGGSSFSDSTPSTGLGPSSMVYTGFGTAAFDVNHDSWLDLHVVNGAVLRGDPAPGAGEWVDPPWDLYAEPNLFYLNHGNGTFRLLREEVETICQPIEVSRGLATGDIDGDGDIDMLLSNAQGPARLYRNDAPKVGRWLKIRTIDPRLNRDAIGARVTLISGDRRYTRTVSMAYSYLSSGDGVLHFGIPQDRRVEAIEVLWPDGLLEQFPGCEPQQMLTLKRGEGEGTF